MTSACFIYGIYIYILVGENYVQINVFETALHMVYLLQIFKQAFPIIWYTILVSWIHVIRVGLARARVSLNVGWHYLHQRKLGILFILKSKLTQAWLRISVYVDCSEYMIRRKIIFLRFPCVVGDCGFYALEGALYENTTAKLCINLSNMSAIFMCHVTLRALSTVGTNR